VSKPAEKRWRGGNRKREEERREGRKKAREDTTMLCCMRRSKQVEKNDEDQKIEEDGINPEDKAHKAATRIQASFRGHTTRKKLQGEKKGDAAEAEGTRRMKPPWLMAWRRREKARPPLRRPGHRPKAKDSGPAGDAPSRRRRGGRPDAAPDPRPPRLLRPQRRRPALLTRKVPLQFPLTTRRPPRPKMSQPRRSLNNPTCLLLSLLLSPPRCRGRCRQGHSPASETAESSQAEEKTDAEDGTRPKESARQDEGKEEDREADQEHASTLRNGFPRPHPEFLVMMIQSFWEILALYHSFLIWCVWPRGSSLSSFSLPSVCNVPFI
jgi:hypothetical protein